MSDNNATQRTRLHLGGGGGRCRAHPHGGTLDPVPGGCAARCLRTTTASRAATHSGSRLAAISGTRCDVRKFFATWGILGEQFC